MSIEEAAKYLLIALLFFIALGNLMNIFTNPEAYLIIWKLGGVSALPYLAANGAIPLILIYLILKSRYIPAIAYFSFHIANSIIISVAIFSRPSFSLISLIGLMLSVIPLAKALSRR